MKINHKVERIVIIIICIMIGIPVMQGQEKSKKFAHINFPDEIKYLAFTSHAGYAGNTRKIWEFNPKDLTFKLLVDISDKNWSTEIQGLAANSEKLFYYVSGEGLYMTSSGVAPEIVCPRSKGFVRNREESYSNMSMDPSEKFLLLYGPRENVVVFDIENGIKPVIVFNDRAKDAYMRNQVLWTGYLDKVVANKRAGKSMDNEDFLYYDINDQHGLIKFPVTDPGKLPNFGEDVIPVNGKGEIVRLLHNIVNDDLLLCLSSMDKAEIFKLDEREITSVAKIEADGIFRDFAAYGNKIIAAVGRGFVEVTYPNPAEQKVDPKPIVTDLIKPKLWPQHKPDPYDIQGAYFMQYDKDGNLWISDSRDLFVIYK